MDRTEGDKLGLTIDPSDGVTLLIVKVFSGGLISSWSVRHVSTLPSKKQKSKNEKTEKSKIKIS